MTLRVWTINSSTIMVQWEATSGTKSYLLGVGTTPESLAADPWGDIGLLVTGTLTSVQVSGIPLSGNPVYMRLWTFTNTDITFEDFLFETVVGEANRPAEIVSPLPGETLTQPKMITCLPDTSEFEQLLAEIEGLSEEDAANAMRQES